MSPEEETQEEFPEEEFLLGVYIASYQVDSPESAVPRPLSGINGVSSGDLPFKGSFRGSCRAVIACCNSFAVSGFPSRLARVSFPCLKERGRAGLSGDRRRRTLKSLLREGSG